MLDGQQKTQARHLWDCEFSDRQIAARLQVPQGVVSAWREAENLAPRKSNRKHWDKEKAARMYAGGANDVEIAAAVGVNPITVGHWRRDTGRPKQPFRNTWNRPRADWDEETAARMYGDGRTDGEIAAAVGVSKSLIASWRRRTHRTPQPPGTRSIATMEAQRQRREAREQQRQQARQQRQDFSGGTGHRFDTEAAATLHREGRTDREIAHALRISRATVAVWRREQGLPVNREPKLRSWDTRKAEIMWRDGFTDQEIADAVGTSRAAVGSWRRRTGVTKAARNGHKGEDK